MNLYGFHPSTKVGDLYMSYSLVQARSPAEVLTDGFSRRAVASHSAHFARLGWLKRVGPSREPRFLRLLDREQFEDAYAANLHAVIQRKNTRYKGPQRPLPAALYHDDGPVRIDGGTVDLSVVEELRERTTLVGLFRQLGVR